MNKFLQIFYWSQPTWTRHVDAMDACLRLIFFRLLNRLSFLGCGWLFLGFLGLGFLDLGFLGLGFLGLGFLGCCINNIVSKCCGRKLWGWNDLTPDFLTSSSHLPNLLHQLVYRKSFGKFTWGLMMSDDFWQFLTPSHLTSVFTL